MKIIKMANERNYIRSQSYDAAGNRTAANDAMHIPGSGQIKFTKLFWLRPQTLLLPGGGKITLSYDDFLQVNERILEDPANNNVAEAVYQYDLENNIPHINATEGLYQFGYDDNYRLASADYPELIAANDEEFGYDGVGNRIHHGVTTSSDTEEPETQELTLVYNDQNQLIQKGDATFTYNANGHTAAKTENGQVTEYLYNHEERLIAARINGQTVGQYAYNPEGHRIKKTVSGVTTYFLYNEEGLAAEYDVSGNLIKEYHFKPYNTWMTEPLFQRTADGQVYYYQNDHLGTPQRMMRSNGAVVWQAYYSAFGEAGIVTEVVQNNFRFPGQYFDQETGLHHNYFRDYDPSLGRYVQSDPIGLKGGVNTYAYGGGSPINAIDPLGLKCRWVNWGNGKSVRLCDADGGNPYGDRPYCPSGDCAAYPPEHNSETSRAAGECVTCVATCIVLGKVEGDLLKKVTDGQARRAAEAGLKVVGKRMVSLISGVGGAVLTAQCTLDCF